MNKQNNEKTGFEKSLEGEQTWPPMKFIVNSKGKELKAMKVIDVSTKLYAKEYLGKEPKDTHTSEELEAVHRAVRFTQTFKQAESNDKMEEEEFLARPLPRIG